jgi:putative ATP-dependent endonuclease of OLD family
MYLHELKLWNFRKYGSGGDLVNEKNKIREPDLKVQFQNGLNVLIGENDSGKTAIIDSIKLVLKTHSTEWIRVSLEDFYNDTKQMRIECIFKNLRDNEAFHFTEWLGMEGEGEKIEPYLKMILDIRHNDERILPFEVRAGVDDIGDPLTAEARDYLKATYLKPLRDAQNELIPKRNSRLSQILEGHEIFKGKADKHKLKDISRCFNCLIQKYFDRNYSSPDCKKGNNCKLIELFFKEIEDEDGQLIRKSLNDYIHNFLGNSEIHTKFGVISPKLKNILEVLKLSYDEEFDPGLGSQNLLFIASELLNLDRSNWTGLRLGLVEELEAHLHPQAQLRVVECLQEFIEDKEKGKKDIQFILSTHSPNLGSKIKLKNLIICSDNEIFPMGHAYTELEENDYSFLQRFLDVTKANLFFANGVILVEGWAEELFLPALAKKIGINLTQKGISIVNVGGLTFLRYAKIFQRQDEKEMHIPVAVITDLDLKPEEENLPKDGKTKKEIVKERKIKKYDGQRVKTFISPHWTFEYCIALSDILRKLFYKSVLLAFKEQKDYQGDEINEKINEAISGIETQFSSWSEDGDSIALRIYNQILGEEKILEFAKTRISKSIIAQHFANLLNKDKSISETNLENDINIRYLVNAIKYAVGENIEDASN